MDADTISKTIDLTGFRCPNLLFSIIEALDDMEDNQLLKIIATDQNAPSNTAVWCRQSDNELVDIYEEHEKFVILIKRAAHQNEPYTDFTDEHGTEKQANPISVISVPFDAPVSPQL